MNPIVIYVVGALMAASTGVLTWIATDSAAWGFVAGWALLWYGVVQFLVVFALISNR